MDEKKSLLDKLAQREVDVNRDVSPQFKRDEFNLDGFLTEIDSAPSKQHLEIPQSVINRFKAQGARLGWIRVKGQGGEDNLINKEREGWKLLPAHAVPEMALSGSGVQKLNFLSKINREDDTQSKVSEFIVRKDVALAVNLESNYSKVKKGAQEQADAMQRSLKGKATGQGLEIDKETKMTTKTGENAIFG